MANDRIDELFDEAAIIAHFNGILDKTIGKLKGFSAIKLEVEGAKSVKDFTLATAKMKEEVKAVESLARQRFATDAKLITLQTDYAKATAANRVEIQKQNQELKAQAQLEAASFGSKERARAAVKKLTIESEKLNLTTAEGRKRNEEIIASIDKYNKFLAKNSDAIAKQKMNVGNYQGSAKIITDALEKEIAKLKELEKARVNVQNAGSSPIGFAGRQNQAATVTAKTGGDFSGFKLAATATTAELKKLDEQIEQSRTVVEGFQRVTNQPQFLNVAGKVGDATAEVKFFTKSLIDLERQGLGNSQAANDLRKNLAGLTDEIGDAKAEIKALSSDTRGLDVFAGSVSFLADAFQTAAGAAVLFGASEEDAAQATKTLFAIQSVANGVKGIANELTTRGTAANKAYAAVQGIVAVATDASAKATVRLAAATKLLLGAAVIGAIAFLIIKLREYQQEQEKAGQSAKDFEEIRKEGLKNSAEELTKLKLLYEASQDQTLSYKDRKRAVDELQKQYPAYFKNLSDESILAGNAASAYDLLSKKIIQTGLAQAAKAKITEISSQILEDILKVEEAEKRIAKVNESGVAVQDKITPRTLASGNIVNDAPIRISVDPADKEKAINSIKALYSEAYLSVDEGNKRIQAIIKGVGAASLTDAIIGEGSAGGSGQSKSAFKKSATDILKTQYEINRLRLQDSADTNRRIFDDETKGYEERLDALKDFGVDQQALVALERQFSIDSETIGLATTLKALEDQKKESGANMKAINEQQELEREASAKRIELIELNSALKLGEIGRNQIADFKKLVAGREAVRQEEIKMWEDYEQDITDIINRIRAAQLKAQDDDLKKAEDIAARKKDLYKQLYAEIQETFFAFLEAGVEKERQILDERKILLDEETARRINDINLLGLNEVERTRQIAIVEKNALFQTEQIEKRKRELSVQRARFDKAASIASIIQSTAQAVIAALGSKPWSVANIGLAALVGGIGALQLTRAIATPIPRYKTGRGKGRDEFAIVGDGGKREPILRASGAVELSPAKDTLTHLAGNDMVFPDVATFLKSIQANQIRNLPTIINHGGTDPELKDLVRKQTRLLSDISKKPTNHIHLEGDMEYKIWYETHIKGTR